MVLESVSRFVMILIVALPTGYVFQEIDQRDWQILQEYSREEFLAYHASIKMPSHAVAMFVVTAVVAGATAIIEIGALLIRALVRSRRRGTANNA